MLESSEFDAFRDVDFVDSLQLEVGVDYVEQVEFVLGNKWVFWIKKILT